MGEAKGFGILPLMVRDVRPTEGGLAKHTVVFPLYIGRRTPSDDLDMVTPLFWRTRVGGEKPRRNLALVPFYFRQRQPHGKRHRGGGWIAKPVRYVRRCESHFVRQRVKCVRAARCALLAAK